MTVYVAVLNGQFSTYDVRVFKSNGAAKTFKRTQEIAGMDYEIFVKKIETMDDLLTMEQK